MPVQQETRHVGAHSVHQASKRLNLKPEICNKDLMLQASDSGFMQEKQVEADL